MQPAADGSAPAKINLALHVTGRRADGYHLIESLAVFTRFGDRMAIEPADRDQFLGRRARFAAAMPLDGGNLVLAAARRAARCRAPRQPLPAGLDQAGKEPAGRVRRRRRVERRGRGAARADADIWSLAIADAAAGANSASELGADVPMCLAAAADRARHRRRDRRPAGLSGAAAGAGQSGRGRSRRPTSSARWPAATTRRCRRCRPGSIRTRASSTGWRATRNDLRRRRWRSRRKSATRWPRSPSRRALRPHVRFRRDLLRPVRDRNRPARRRAQIRRRQPGWFVDGDRDDESESMADGDDLTKPPLHPRQHRGADRLRHPHARRRQVRPDARRPHRRGGAHAGRARHRHRRRDGNPRPRAGMVARPRRSTW